jgi:hypothetical protein
MAKLIISGKKQYTKRLYKHLQQEHPSTKHRMILRDRINDVSKDEYYKAKINYCELCGKPIKPQIITPYKIAICKQCLEKQYR